MLRPCSATNRWIRSIRALKASSAPFKLVAIGSQVLNDAADYENYATMPQERAELLRRIEEEGIHGVLLLGDRHFTELSEVKLKDGKECSTTLRYLP